MPIAKIQLEDGRIAKFDVPEGTTQEQVIQYAQQQFSSQTSQTPIQATEQTQTQGEPREPILVKDEVTPFPEPRTETRAARELPEMEGILAGEDMWDIVKTVPALSTATDPQEIAEILQKNFDNIGITQDPGGNLLATNNATGRQVIINRPGFSKLDLMQGLTLGSLFLPTSVSGLSAGALAKGAALAAATQTGIEGYQKALGGEMNASDIGIAALASPIGQIAGEAVVAPIIKQTIKKPLAAVLRKGKDAFASMVRSADDMGEEVAAKSLAESMIREGLTPDELLKRFNDLGQDAVLGDTGNSFRRLLRSASNEVPELEGRMNAILNKRQAMSDKRVLQSLKAVGLSNMDAAEEMARLNASVGPKIAELYAAARSKPLNPSWKLRRILNGKNIISKTMASDTVQDALANKRSLDESISNIDVIDETKKALDDQISSLMRKGKTNKARDIIRLKKIMLEEVDKAIPEYAQARSVFAGKAALEDSAEKGRMMFKLSPADMNDLVSSMGESEKRMFLLGAKDALIDKMDATQVTGDMVKRIFGRRGDIKRIKTLFPDSEQFDIFRKVMESEAEFMATRRAVQGNSTTFRQLFDSVSFGKSFEEARALTGDPIAAVGVVDNLIKSIGKGKQEQVRRAALERIGDMLISSDVDPNRVRMLLKKGSQEQIKSALNSVISSKATRAATIEQATRRNED